MKHFLQKYIDPWLPRYAILPLTTCILMNTIVYYGTMYLARFRTVFYDFTTVWDEAIPAISPFIFIYGSCYLFWALNYVLIARLGRRNLFELVSADLVAKGICLLFFIFLPTTNIRPVLTGTTISDMLMLFMYRMDSPVNLLPSIHCLTSWFCFIGIRGQEGVPKWYRVFSSVYAIAICASTLFTKQHILMDVVAGILLAEATYCLARHTLIPKSLDRLYSKIPLLS